MASKPALKLAPPPQPSTVFETPVSNKTAGEKPHLVIFGIETGMTLADFGELWEYRELALLLAWRDIKLRYSQTVLGFTWTILQPLLSMGIFTLLFGKLAKMPSEGLPYPVFCYLGLLPWMYFSNGIGRSGTILVANGHILGRVYFPRMLLPLGSLLPGFVDLAVGVVSALPLLWMYGYTVPLSALLWIPALSFLAAAQVLGMSLIFSAVHVRFRDMGNLMGFVLQTGMWLTPITYPTSVVPDRFRTWIHFNPTLGFIEGFRAAFTGKPVDLTLVGISVAFAALTILGGSYYFRRVERTFADIA